MSDDIYLNDPVTHRAIEFDEPHDIGGGTYQIGGTTVAWLSVTYNYSKIYRTTIDAEKGIRSIYGMTGAESMPVLENAIAKLGDDVVDNYWLATEGNAKRALCGLLAFARLRPDGIWSGD